MRLGTRKVLDRSFSGLGLFSLFLMCAALVVILGPIFARGTGAFIFKETVERRRVMNAKFGRGDPERLEQELAAAQEARKPVFRMLRERDEELWDRLVRMARRREAPAGLLEDFQERKGDVRDAIMDFDDWAWRAGIEDDELLDELGALREGVKQTAQLKETVRRLLGPLPTDEDRPEMLRKRYGAARWYRVEHHLNSLLYETVYEYPDPDSMGVPVQKPRVDQFRGTAVEPLFEYTRTHIEQMLRPRWTFYWRFLFDASFDAHIFGGIWPSLLGTLYLTFGTMLLATPLGVISAVYLTEYAGQGVLVSLLRTCISTLAGVPSVAFGLFGLAFFINTLHLTDSISVLVGCMTLALLVLPTVIRASEEAIRAVPHTYKQASLSLGATRWRTIVRVILPAGLPGIITSIIISMGRAAGETAPILFTAAVAMGPALKPWEALSRPTMALPYSIYALVTEHRAVEEIRHVQYGMVTTLILLVLLLNLAAIVLRARVSRKLRG